MQSLIENPAATLTGLTVTVQALVATTTVRCRRPFTFDAAISVRTVGDAARRAIEWCVEQLTYAPLLNVMGHPLPVALLFSQTTSDDPTGASFQDVERR